jgi:hypothetical protein
MLHMLGYDNGTRLFENVYGLQFGVCAFVYPRQKIKPIYLSKSAWLIRLVMASFRQELVMLTYPWIFSVPSGGLFHRGTPRLAADS